MIRLLLFLKKIYPFLLFLAIEIVCLGVFLSQSGYQRAKMIAISHTIVGSLHGYITNTSNYFSLQRQNEELLKENARLYEQLSLFEEMPTLRQLSLDKIQDYKIVKVINNTYTKRNNYITIDAGTKQGIEPDMALFNSDGVVGYVKYCSENFSVAVSILNSRDFRTSGTLMKESSPGSLYWDGGDYREVVMEEIPAHTPIEIGDTIVTTEYSNIFPPGIVVGTVSEVKEDYNLLMSARVRLAADMTKLHYLYAVSLEANKERAELEAVIEATQEELLVQ